MNRIQDPRVKHLRDMFRRFSSTTPPSGASGGGWLGMAPWMTVLLVVVGFASLSCFYKIEPSQQGVITRWGAFSHIANDGPHMKLPFGIEQVFKVEVSRVHELQFGFRKSPQPALPAEQARLESLMLTGDLNVAVVEWILQYRIQDPRKFLFHGANVEQTIRDACISMMRRVVGDKLVSDVLTTDRVQIAQKAKELTQTVLDGYDLGIHITQINLQNVTPPEEVKPAFNEINIAKQEQEQLINQAQGTYNKVIPEAEGQAERQLAEAEAYGINLVNRAKGDSEKYRQLLLAYKAAPALMKKRMYLETMEEVLANLSELTIVDPNLKGLLPMYPGKLASHGAALSGAASADISLGDTHPGGSTVKP